MSDYIDTTQYFKVATLDEGIPGEAVVVSVIELNKWIRDLLTDAVEAHYNYPVIIGPATPSERKDYENTIAYEGSYSLTVSELETFYDVIHKFNEMKD